MKRGDLDTNQYFNRNVKMQPLSPNLLAAAADIADFDSALFQLKPSKMESSRVQ